MQANLANGFRSVLLRSGYSHVIYCDCDELVIPNPTLYPGGLYDYVEHNLHRTIVTTTGYEVAEGLTDPDFDWSRFPVLQQRRKWYPVGGVSKPLLSSVMINCTAGCHGAMVYNEVTGESDLHIPPAGTVCADPDLYLVHMKTADCRTAGFKCKDPNWDGPRDSGCGRCYWHLRLNATLYDIPESVRGCV